LFKVEKDSQLAVFGGFHLLGIPDPRVPGLPSRLGPAPPRFSATPQKVRPAEVKRKVDPSYPEAARKAGIGGLVKIAMVILPDGTVNDLVALSAPNTDLAVAAILAVRRWQYSPTYLGNVPVEASLTVNVAFQR
jgi:protein TonB